MGHLQADFPAEVAGDHGILRRPLNRVQANGYSCLPSAMGLAAMIYFGAWVLTLRGGVISPDTNNYIGYWDQITRGNFHTTPMQVPKPAPVILFGLLHELFGGNGAATSVYVAAGALLVFSVAQLAHANFGRLAAWLIPLTIMLSSDVWWNVMAGATELLSTSVLVWLASRHLQKEGVRPPDAATGLALTTAIMIRPESIVVAIIVAATFALWLLFRSVARQQIGRAAMAALILPLASPALWLVFDRLAFGDWLFSTHLNQHYAAVLAMLNGRSLNPSLWRYPYFVYQQTVGSITPSLVVPAVVGIAVLFARRPAVAIPLSILFIAPVLFYVSFIIDGMSVEGRFFFPSVVVLLVLAGLGVSELVNWLAVTLREQAGPWMGPGLAVILRLGVALALAIAIVLPISLALKDAVSAVRRQDDIRYSVLSAAEAIRHDADYNVTTPVIVFPFYETAVAWRLGSNGRNINDPLDWIYDGRLFGDIQRVGYFIQEPNLVEVHNTKFDRIMAVMESGEVAGVGIDVLYDDGMSRVYKLRRLQ